MKLTLTLCAALLTATSAFSATYDCRISPKKSIAHYDGVTPSQLRVTISSGGNVRVSDNVARRAGRNQIEGKLGRRVGNVQIFSWSLAPVPRKMLPPVGTQFYEPKVNYRARLDTSSGKFSMRGSFITSGSGDSAGVNMQGFGRCRRV